ncbi:hypothetical protein CPB84DRAFT_1788334 [Gymnopilus junonius]|uniref:Uncharacterized protein n=1 Tax=Gymnopilus junonius TaxID=109634 RepID=A0A9P5NIM2_GYMJU|nr:hypothetical protein CPB84DRAFT_1788334 [Gymnopilus junonius]
MKSFALPALNIATIMAHIASSAAYTALVYIGPECATGTNVQPEFQITGFDLSAGHSGCIAPVTGTSRTWESISVIGCTSPGSTTLYSDANCKNSIATFSGNVACDSHPETFNSFSVTGC